MRKRRLTLPRIASFRRSAICGNMMVPDRCALGCRIAINKCRDWRRRQRVRQLFIFSAATSDDEIEQVPDDAPSAHASAASKMELEKLSTAIAALTSSLREVLLLRTVEGLKQ